MFATPRPAKVVAGIAWIYARRSDPGVTLEDVMGRRWAEVEVAGPEEAPEETEGAPEPGPVTPSPSSPTRSGTHRRSTGP